MKNLNKEKKDPPRIEQAWERLRESGRRYGKLSSSTAETFLQFIYTIESMSAHLSHKTRARGLTRAGLNVLTILRSSQGKGCQHNQISRLLLVSRANVTGLVNSLIKQGLVERVYDEKDRRVCIARITKKGETLLDAFLPDYHAAIENIFSGLSVDDKKTFNHLMENLRSAINRPKNKRSI
ncbi:MAG: MarR family transcriptional regulator [Candidatus Omnitrophica bacterium]|nr:MarR family transcriptional regulator [Candidatus Omnitrophota bacterium]